MCFGWNHPLRAAPKRDGQAQLENFAVDGEETTAFESTRSIWLVTITYLAA